jgi:hypothetical protein
MIDPVAIAIRSSHRALVDRLVLCRSLPDSRSVEAFFSSSPLLPTA